MTHTIRVALTESEMKRLREKSSLNCRRPQEQARFLVLNALGLLEIDEPQKIESGVPALTGQHATSPI